MPTSGRDTVAVDVLYPDELPGSGLVPDPDRLNGELAFWDADDLEDREDLPGQGASYGWWLPVLHPEHGEVWAVAPRALREWLVANEVEPGDAFEVTKVVEGDEEHDPYEVEARRYEGDGGPSAETISGP